jgi:hypothetical protein
MTLSVDAAPTGDMSGTLQAIGDGPGAQCYLGYDGAGPSLYVNFGHGIASMSVGTPGVGVSSWILSMHPSVTLGVVTLTTGHTSGVGYTNPFCQTQFKIRNFGPGYSPGPVQIEVYLVDATGARDISAST